MVMVSQGEEEEVRRGAILRAFSALVGVQVAGRWGRKRCVSKACLGGCAWFASHNESARDDARVRVEFARIATRAHSP